MKILIDSDKKIANSSLSALQNGDYVPSKYNFRIPYDNKFLVYNVFSKCFISLEKEEIDILKPCKISLDTASDEQKQLIRNRFLVLADCDEQSTYVELVSLLETISNNKPVNSYTVLTTTGCNARCFYCFEQDFVPVSMSHQIAADTASYMVAHSKNTPVFISWFGGEPLCNIPAIDTISGILNENQMNFTSMITTNGLLVSEDVIKRAVKDWHLIHAQVTLDGFGEEHNRRKNFKVNCPDPFAQTIRNIHIMLDNGMSVIIRINFDVHNADNVRELLAYLCEEFRDDEKLRIYPSKLFEECGAWTSQNSDEDREQLNRCINEFADYLLSQRKYRRHPLDNKIKSHYCGSNSKRHRTVGPDGTLMICHNMNQSGSFGTIYDDITDPELFDHWTMNNVIREKCNGCKFLPNCTMFSQCPNMKPHCVADKTHLISKAMIARYLRLSDMDASKV